MPSRGRFQHRLTLLAVVVVGFALAGVTQPSAPAAEPSRYETIVYVTKTGSKYHRDGCQYLRQSKIPMPLSQAARWYEPCSRCHPPTP